MISALITVAYSVARMAQRDWSVSCCPCPCDRPFAASCSHSSIRRSSASLPKATVTMQALSRSRGTAPRTPSRRSALNVAAVASADVKVVTLKAKRVTPEGFAPFGQVGRRGGRRAARAARRAVLRALPTRGRRWAARSPRAARCKGAGTCAAPCARVAGGDVARTCAPSHVGPDAPRAPGDRPRAAARARRAHVAGAAGPPSLPPARPPPRFANRARCGLERRPPPPPSTRAPGPDRPLLPLTARCPPAHRLHGRRQGV
jgi:hypothetical protein